MRILITAAASRPSQELAASLAKGHEVVLTDRSQVSTQHSFVRSDLGHDQSTHELVRGMDAIIHPGEVAAGDSVSDQLDYLMRCTYNLLWAASEEGVPRLIYLGTLRVMDRYDEDFVVTERWRPVPTTEVSVLRYHVGEYVCREFARENKIGCVSLRLGELVWDTDKAGDLPTSALYPNDMVQAVESALNADLQGWDVFHVQSAVPGARFLTTAAEESLGYRPVARGEVRA